MIAWVWFLKKFAIENYRYLKAELPVKKKDV